MPPTLTLTLALTRRGEARAMLPSYPPPTRRGEAMAEFAEDDAAAEGVLMSKRARDKQARKEGR